jgi:multidrug efflux pump subunit AcrA (membrane-fusion protein)
MINKALLATVILLILFFLGGCGNNTGANSEPEATPAAKEQVTNVKTMLLKPQDLAETFVLPANLEAWEDLTLAA